jgi:hypothetical protein
MRPVADARDVERGARRDDPHGGGIDAGELEGEVQRGRVVGAIAVALWLEAAPLGSEARHIPKLSMPGHGGEIPCAGQWQASG